MEQLNEEISALRELTRPESPDVAIGRVSRMDAINNRGVMEATLRNAETKLSGLEYALENINSPDFGLCAKCKHPIQEGRILLMPEKRLCLRCSH